MVVGEISQERNLIIIGGGPGGYSAAIRAAQLGLTVTLIEQADMGGVCLNNGCIPSKVFTHAAAKLSETAHLNSLGIGSSAMIFDFQKLSSYKTNIINQLRSGVESLCKENKIEIIRGKATFLSVDKIGVENGHQFDIYTFEQLIIATGSNPITPEVKKVKDSRVLSTHEIYKMDEIPEHLIVRGQDYIALEIASSFAALGAHVSVVIDAKLGLPFDDCINKELTRLFKKRKIKMLKEVDFISKNETEEDITITFLSDRNVVETISGSHLFVSETRKPNLEELGIIRFGIELTAEGFIKIDNDMRSSIPSIYAIGDITGGPMLAGKAIKQGKAAAASIAGIQTEVDLTFMPVVAHTIPPVVSVGLTEKSARDIGIDIRVSQFTLGGNGYATITGKKDGFIKVISDSTTEIIQGIHMIGEGAVEMSGSFVQLLEMAAKEEDIIFPHYAHPGYNEGLLEVVEGLVGQAIHTSPMKKKDLTKIS
ncbi:dihydrolipoyl dehydrogenase family protein [Psychrobacillus lasiicapitis]|uniref:Dihydrolipoyl dehydrogenase n=1 Tax=Psychrobacillus lasiicapitis TaxID=1636719 RepID=A0A544SWI9_9BACI|nr:FAD-dependent oxidoreductase [Psychrobacillus lasiicapitis]TQR09556.1 dihydrolipoyl dehydrogenase [Psychrobacillus lasiicapitis]GGA29487.1 dihydrolipoyl dehydrogenase [Psychrobacillus lasiicapitis]